METSQNQRIFNFLGKKTNPPIPLKKILLTLVFLHWGSVRAFAKEIGYSHTEVNRVLIGKSKHSESAEIVFTYLDIESPFL